MAVRTTWTAGDVLTAADLTDTFGAKANLASPTFTGTPAAPTAAAGTNTTQVATTAFVQAASGLTLITTQSFSAASSVSVNNCFSATYDNYRVLVEWSSFGAADVNVQLRLRASGTDNSTANSYLRQFVEGSSTSVGGNQTLDTWARVALGSSSYSDVTALSLDIMRPFKAAKTTMLGNNASIISIGNYYLQHIMVLHNQATAYDGFTLYASTSTMSGTLRVYGYRN